MSSTAARMMGRRSPLWGDSPAIMAARKAAQRRAEADQWLADHAAELASPDIATDVVIDAATGEVAAPRWYDDEVIDGTWSNADDHGCEWDGTACPECHAPAGRLTDEARLDAADAAREAIDAMLHDPDLPGWGTTFDPADCQWGFTTHRSPHTLPGAVSGRPQPAHLVR